MSKKNNKGFTLIELLVVVGIIAVLAIAALIAINPIEAQRRSRDSARLEDMSRVSAAIESFMNDNGVALMPGAVNSGAVAVGIRSQPCDANWTTLDLCDYLKQVPTDPSNRGTANIVTTAAGARGPMANMRYAFIYVAATGNYELCTYLESDRSAINLNDGGNDADSYEIGIGTAVAATNCGL